MSDDGASDADGTGESAPAPHALRRILTDPARRRIALVVGALLGIGLAWVHWVGLFAAGALVGLASRDLPRAVGAGLAVGALAVALHVLAAPAMDPGEFLALTPPAYVTLAGGLLLPALGSLLRGVV